MSEFKPEGFTSMVSFCVVDRQYPVTTVELLTASMADPRLQDHRTQ
jgi:hypothetical protein